LLILAIVSLAGSCISSSGLFVSGSNTPSFEIRRSFFAEVRAFPIFIVRQLHPDNARVGPLQEDDSKNREVWKIRFSPNETIDSSEKIERIEYGKIPAGFLQEVPSQGLPEQLQENQIYEAVGPLSLMGNAVVRFKIVNGNVVSLVVP
jgi:hypothetical protein